ncbi:uncharacterized protein isoform X3 [Rhodnius prolixus]|uniref:uncharacterized protein isoform X3 n=1 Tax=Rhodnius prolixus TaxID=13249 RepID=UPI003D18F129
MIFFHLEYTMAENLYSPVEVPESPAKKAKGNLTGIPRIVHDSSADLYNCIQEWNGNHITGVSVINEICNLKITHLNSSNASVAFPAGLEELCNSLEDVCSKLNTVLNKIKEVKNHYEGLMKLNEMKNINTPVFTTWRVQEFDRFKNYGIQKQPRGHPFYQTTSSTYGYLPPSKHTFPHCYFPLSRSFTSQLSNFGMYRNYSLNV